MPHARLPTTWRETAPSWPDASAGYAALRDTAHWHLESCEVGHDLRAALRDEKTARAFHFKNLGLTGHVRRWERLARSYSYENETNREFARSEQRISPKRQRRTAFAFCNCCDGEIRCYQSARNTLVAQV